MLIRRAEKKDYTTVARLHSEGIATGFLSTLGATFLSRLYEAINLQAGSCVLVAECDGEVSGFVAGAANTKGLYKKVILRKWMSFILPLSKYVFNIAIIKRMLETLFYGLKKDKSEITKEICTAELLSIVVDSRYRGKNVGRNLVDTLESFFKGERRTEYKVVTLSSDCQSNNFYKACNFKFIKTFIYHNNVMNEYHKEIYYG